MENVVEIEDEYAPPIGYPQLANHIAEHPDFAVFRRFSALSSRNLLYFQAELCELEKELEEVELKDDELCKSGGGRDLASKWYWLSGRGKNAHNERQLALVLKIREILRQYHEALALETKTLAMPGPKARPLRELCFYTEAKLHGRIVEARQIYGSIENPESRAGDLIALHEFGDEDCFSEYLVEKFPPWFHQHIACRFSKSQGEKDRLATYKYENFLRFTALIATTIACLLPILSISVLHSIRSMKARLGAMAGLNVLLSVSLALFTTAKRVEIFAVTAAFAAIQVVFVASNGSVIQ